MNLSRRAMTLGLGSTTVAMTMGSSMSSAFADAAYPSRTVTVVVTYAAGGMTDIIGRMLSADFHKSFGQPFIVENRPGAAGQLGTEFVSRRPGDGYTLLVNATGYAVAPAMQKVGYDPVKDFITIAVLTRAPNLLLVNKSVPVKSFAEFLEWAKTQGELPYGSSGVGGSSHLSGEILRVRSGRSLVHVPYKGAAPLVNDLLAGHIKVAFQDSLSVAPFIASGDIRALAVTTAERSSLFPDLPSIAESGFPGFDLYTWVAFFAPKGTPQDIVDRLNKGAVNLLHEPANLEWLRKMNCEPGPKLDAKGAGEFIAAEVEKWAGVVRASGVKI